MKLSTSLLFAIQISSYIVAAKPFIIVSTRVQNVLPTHTILPRQNLLDTINSAVDNAFGDDDDSSTSLVAAATRASVTKTSAVTLPPPVTASATSSSKQSKSTKSTKSSDQDQSSSDDSQGSASTSSDESSAATSSTTESSTTQSSSTTQTSTSTSLLTSTTPTPGPSSGLGASSTATPSATADKTDDNGVPAGGVAVAVIMILLILGVTAFLIFRYNPRCQAWWAAREERLRQERSYREAIDGPGVGSSPTLRQQALSGNASRRRTMLASFFAPATARLSENTEIRRKPVNWGAPASPAVPKVPAVPSNFTSSKDIESDPDNEKISLTASAAPLGQIERYSMIPAATQLPAPPPPPKPLPSPKIESDVAPTFLPIPTSGSFVAELPACVPTISTPPVQPQSNDLARNASNSYGFGPELSAMKRQPSAPKTPTAQSHPMTLPVSPISLHPQVTSPNLGPVSPLSTFTTSSPGLAHMRSISALTTSTVSNNHTHRSEPAEVPMLPPLPSIPSLVHAKRGSDGVFRLV